MLYLALEDGYERLQRRMYRMFGVEGTKKLHFAICAKQLGNGLDAKLEKFVREHPDTRLIIIDSLQKVREPSGEAYSYRDDYQIIGQLKQFADKFGLCLLIVHHTRKSAANDECDRISGTTGLYGCADGAFVLSKENRTDNAATLSVSGRDQPDQRIHLVRDEERLLWCFDHADKEPYREPPDPLLEKVAALVTVVTMKIGALKHRHHRHPSSPGARETRGAAVKRSSRCLPDSWGSRISRRPVRGVYRFGTPSNALRRCRVSRHHCGEGYTVSAYPS